MTVGLLKLAPAGSDQHAFYLGLAARAWRQLSDYARDRLRERAPEEGALLDDQPADSAPEWQTHRQSRANELVYLFKSGEPATVSLLRAGGEEVYEGARLHWKGGSVYTLRPAVGEPFDIDQAEILALEDFDYR